MKLITAFYFKKKITSFLVLLHGYSVQMTWIWGKQLRYWLTPQIIILKWGLVAVYSCGCWACDCGFAVHHRKRDGPRNQFTMLSAPYVFSSSCGKSLLAMSLLQHCSMSSGICIPLWFFFYFQPWEGKIGPHLCSWQQNKTSILEMLKMARKKNQCTVIKYFFWQWFCQVPQNHNISLDYFIFKVTLAFWGQVNFDIKHFSYNNALKTSCMPSKVSEFLERKMIIVDFPNLQKILFLNIFNIIAHYVSMLKCTTPLSCRLPLNVMLWITNLLM